MLYCIRSPKVDNNSPGCLGQDIEREPFGLRVKLTPVYHTQRKLHSVSVVTKRQAVNANFIVFG